jgi:serine protease inhibitor
MTRILSLILLVCICIGSAQCASGTVSARELTAAEKGLVESDNQFGFTLFQNIAGSESEKDKNIFISPLSVAMALGMTYNGAAGTTRQAMQEVLGLSGLTIQEVNESYQSLIELLAGLDPKVRFQLANSIWYRQEWLFEQEFIDLNKTYFDAEVSGLDFNDPGAKDVINAWVYDNTNGKIEDIVDQIDIDTVMFLINAIYFKGTWTYEFDEELTKDDLFNLPDGSQKSCRMMTQEGDFQYFENSDFQAIDLPYGDGDYSMTILLPKAQNDVDALIEEMTEANWSQWTGSLSEEAVRLELPKFRLEYEIKLKETLKALGMGIAFGDGADFSNMHKSVPLFIHEVKHKTFVEVNEEGTEAAAATSVEMKFESMPDAPISMRVDRPFVFAIQEHHSGTMLFMGKIVDPIVD